MWIVVLGCFILGGCGGGNVREPAGGVVALDGKAVVQGSVVLEPLENNNAPQAGTTIVDGEFSLRGKNGLVPGKYLVKVSAVGPTGRKTQAFGKQIDEAAPVAIKEAAGIPITVVKGGPNRFELQVHSERR